MGSDLDDMQAMIDSTLAYLRGEADPEPRKIINVASLLMSIADASSDAGRDVVYDGPGRALATVRPVALRRALENLVDNAVRYGSRARLSLAVEPDNLLVLVEDDGSRHRSRRRRPSLRALHPAGGVQKPRYRGHRAGADYRAPGHRGRARLHHPHQSAERRFASAGLVAAHEPLTHFVTSAALRRQICSLYPIRTRPRRAR